MTSKVKGPAMPFRRTRFMLLQDGSAAPVRLSRRHARSFSFRPNGMLRRLKTLLSFVASMVVDGDTRASHVLGNLQFGNL
jgi:hypothetical protein